MDEDDEGDWEDWVEWSGFTGDCLCAHEREAHGWGACGAEVYDATIVTSRDAVRIRLQCLCPAGWEE